MAREAQIPLSLEGDLRETLGKSAFVNVVEEGTQQSIEKIKKDRRERAKEKEYYLGKVKRRDDKIKGLEKEVKAQNMQIYELKGVLEQNGNPLQDKLSTLEKNLEHLTALYYQLVSQKSTLQLEKNVREA